MADEQVLAALARAVEGERGDVDLRLHYAAELVRAGRPADGWAQAEQVLAQHPDHIAANQVAASAARASGDLVQAAAYLRVASALEATESQNVPATVAPPSAPEDGANLNEPLPLRVVELDANDEGLPAEVERPRVTLADVGGMEAVKHRLEISFLAPMRSPQLREMYGKSLRGGLLLWGPPGCGKTFIARATAGELGAKFIGVGLADVLDMWVGLSERNLHGVFDLARRHAPCVLFIDELDALGQKRMNTRHAPTMRNVIAQLLMEMDGAMTDNEGVFVLAATNAPWDIDAALKRPGRLDRSLLVLPPDQPARRAILASHLAGRPLAQQGLDLGAIAARTDGLSGADIAQIAEAAAELALSDAIASGVARPIGQGDLVSAMKETPSSLGEWFAVARNFTMFQNEGGLFDELLGYMRQHKVG